MIGNATGVDARLTAFLEHGMQGLMIHGERQVQVEVVLWLEVKGLLRIFKEGDTGAILHLVKAVQNTRRTTRLSQINFKGLNQGKPRKSS